MWPEFSLPKVLLRRLWCLHALLWWFRLLCADCRDKCVSYVTGATHDEPHFVILDVISTTLYSAALSIFGAGSTTIQIALCYTIDAFQQLHVRWFSPAVYTLRDRRWASHNQIHNWSWFRQTTAAANAEVHAIDRTHAVKHMLLPVVATLRLVTPHEDGWQ
jgi:hypothetical protein